MQVASPLAAIYHADEQQHADDHENFDAASALLARGAFLQRLRQLEKEDEAARQAEAQLEEVEAEQSSSSDTLQYSRYLANQRGVYDDYKHVNYKYIEFDNHSADNNSTTSKPLVIQQDRTLGKGGFVWDAGYILADDMIRNKEEWSSMLKTSSSSKQPQSVIELGAGTGVTGLMLANHFSSSISMHLTDLPQLQPLLKANASSQSFNNNVTTGVLEWGKPVAETYHVILAADVVAGIYDGQALIESLYSLAHDQTRIFLSVNEGRLAGIIDEVVSELERRFSVVKRRQPHSDNQNPNITIFCISGKRQLQ